MNSAFSKVARLFQKKLQDRKNTRLVVNGFLIYFLVITFSFAVSNTGTFSSYNDVETIPGTISVMEDFCEDEEWRDEHPDVCTPPIGPSSHVGEESKTSDGSETDAKGKEGNGQQTEKTDKTKKPSSNGSQNYDDTTSEKVGKNEGSATENSKNEKPNGAGEANDDRSSGGGETPTNGGKEEPTEGAEDETNSDGESEPSASETPSETDPESEPTDEVGNEETTNE